MRLRTTRIMSPAVLLHHHYVTSGLGLGIFRPLDFVAKGLRCSLEFVVGDRHGHSLLPVKCCLGVQNNTWIVKVLKDDYTLTYCFSVLKRSADRT
jgi:hypothetical protein